MRLAIGHTAATGEQIVDAVDIPVLAAGAIVDGRGLAAALALGAQGVWMGTRFIASEEANAAAVYKEKIVAAGGGDTRVSRCYSGKPMRVLANPYVEDWERRPADMQPFPAQLAYSWQQGVTDYTATADIDPERTMMPCGQVAGAIGEVLPVRDFVRLVLADADATLDRLATLR